LKLIISDKP